MIPIDPKWSAMSSSFKSGFIPDTKIVSTWITKLSEKVMISLEFLFASDAFSNTKLNTIRIMFHSNTVFKNNVVCDTKT